MQTCPAASPASRRRAGVKRLVHISALGASADSPSAYARSKAAGEAAVTAAFPRATILRPSIVFGPEDQFFNRFAAMTRISPVLPLIGGGSDPFSAGLCRGRRRRHHGGARPSRRSRPDL